METRKTPKQQVRELLDEPPDDVTKEQIAHEIYVQQKIDESLADPRPSTPVDELIERLKEWREAGRP